MVLNAMNSKVQQKLADNNITFAKLVASFINPQPLAQSEPASAMPTPGSTPEQPTHQKSDKDPTTKASKPEATIVKLIFKDSPFFTQKRRTEIKREINKYYRYLVSLGFSPPTDAPPLGVHNASEFRLGRSTNTRPTQT